MWCHQRSKSGLAKWVTASSPHNRYVMGDQRSIPESLLLGHRVHHCRKRIFRRLRHFVLICVDPFLCIKNGLHERLMQQTPNTCRLKLPASITVPFRVLHLWSEAKPAPIACYSAFENCLPIFAKTKNYGKFLVSFFAKKTECLF